MTSEQPKVIPFLAGFMSQWHPCTFAIDGVTYNCSEQYMMVVKAGLFGDEDIAGQILAAKHPRDQKRLGREIRGYDDATWAKHRRDAVLKGNIAKFTQSEKLKKRLLETGDAILVEANPHDAIWGVALAEDDPRVLDPKQWQGLNLLGDILMEVRAMLRA